jgi:hypothetical protein
LSFEFSLCWIGLFPQMLGEEAGFLVLRRMVQRPRALRMLPLQPQPSANIPEGVANLDRRRTAAGTVITRF